MVLAIDIGNTNIVAGCFEGENIRFIERLSTNKNSTALEYTVLIKTVLELNGIQPSSLEGGIISSVVPSVTSLVKTAMEKLTGTSVLVVGPGLKTGLKIGIDNPAQAGADLVTGAVGAIDKYPCPLIIIDMGTATTVTVVDRNKTFIGGLITAGLGMSLDSLAGKTSQLPHISLETPKKVIGTNTVDCMQSGIVYGNACAIDGIIDRIETELGDKCTVVSTGGLSSLVIPHCTHDIIIDDQLLLSGLMLIYNKNK